MGVVHAVHFAGQLDNLLNVIAAAGINRVRCRCHFHKAVALAVAVDVKHAGFFQLFVAAAVDVRKSPCQ